MGSCPRSRLTRFSEWRRGFGRAAAADSHFRERVQYSRKRRHGTLWNTGDSAHASGADRPECLGRGASEWMGDEPESATHPGLLSRQGNAFAALRSVDLAHVYAANAGFSVDDQRSPGERARWQILMVDELFQYQGHRTRQTGVGSGPLAQPSSSWPGSRGEPGSDYRPTEPHHGKVGRKSGERYGSGKGPHPQVSGNGGLALRDDLRRRRTGWAMLQSMCKQCTAPSIP